VALGADDVQTALLEHFLVDLLPFFLEAGDLGLLGLGVQVLAHLDGVDDAGTAATQFDVGTPARHGGGGGGVSGLGAADGVVAAGELPGVFGPDGHESAHIINGGAGAEGEGDDIEVGLAGGVDTSLVGPVEGDDIVGEESLRGGGGFGGGAL